MTTRQNRKTGDWFYRFSEGGEDYSQFGFSTQEAAGTAERHKKNELEDRTLHPEKYKKAEAEAVTFKDAAEWYLKNVTPTKRCTYLDKARIPVMIKLLGDKPLISLSLTDVITLRNHVAALPGKNGLCTKRTVNHYHVLFKALLNSVRESYRTPSGQRLSIPNVAAEVGLEKVPEAAPRFLLQPELAKLTLVILNGYPRLYPYFLTGSYTGARIGEICKLTANYIDVPKRDIFIADSKNGRSRHVPMSNILASYLEPLIEKSKPNLHPFGGFTRFTIGRWFTEAAKAAGLVGVTFHCLRHTFVNRLLQKGKTLDQIARILGHSTTAVTYKVYGHMAAKQLKEVVDSLD